MILRIYRKINNKLKRLFFDCYYYFYNLTDRDLSCKINRILSFNEKSINMSENEQEEQALPGMSKYFKNGWYKYMLGRYLFSLKYIKNKSVLDTACGFGWGSYLISNYAKKIAAVDINSKALAFAKKTWKEQNLIFKQLSILELEKLKETFDVVLGYEIIEHLNISDGEKYILQISKVLKNNGVLIMSSYFPESKKDAKKIEKRNIFHLHIYTKSEVRYFLNKHDFNNVKYYGDLIIIASKDN